MITSWPLKVASASGIPPYTSDRHQPALHESSKVKSPCHIPTVVSWLTDEKSLSTWRAVHRPPPKDLSGLAWLRPPSSHDHGHQCASPSWLDHGLQVHLQTRSIPAYMYISKLARSRSWSASSSSLDQGLPVYLHICSNTAYKCTSKLAGSRPWSVSLSSPNRHFQAHLKFLSRTACSSSRHSVCRWVAI